MACNLKIFPHTSQLYNQRVHGHLLPEKINVDVGITFGLDSDTGFAHPCFKVFSVICVEID